jgi:hypothetical protein
MRRRPPRVRAAVSLPLLLLALGLGCTLAPRRHADLGRIYERAARVSDAERNPVVVIPGILGSKLRDTASDRLVWGAFLGTWVDPATPDGARLVALPMAEGVPLAALRDEVTPAGVLDRLRITVLGLPLDLHAYAEILRDLGVGGYRDQSLGESGAVDYGGAHFTCFQFDYDWRRDLAENAARLAVFLEEKRAYVAARTGKPAEEIRFDVVAHSMGGLLARYFLRYGAAPLPEDGSLPPVTWDGTRAIDRAVVVGTPNAGAVDALLQLVEGARFAFFLPRYEPAVLGTMPALYQLLPRARHGLVRVAAGPDGGEEVVDPLDPATWERFGWGLAAPGQDAVLARLLPEAPDAGARRRIALDHLRKSLARARQLHAALDAPAPPPPDLRLVLFAGDSEATPASVAVEAATGRARVASHAAGDGRVLRTSALLDERVGRAWTPGVETPVGWSRVTFLFGDHLEITRAPVFTDNLLFELLESRP